MQRSGIKGEPKGRRTAAESECRVGLGSPKNDFTLISNQAYLLCTKCADEAIALGQLAPEGMIGPVALKTLPFEISDCAREPAMRR